MAEKGGGDVIMRLSALSEQSVWLRDETWPDETWPDETWPDETWPDETWPDETANETSTGRNPAGAVSHAPLCAEAGCRSWLRRRVWLSARVGVRRIAPYMVQLARRCYALCELCPSRRLRRRRWPHAGQGLTSLGHRGTQLIARSLD